MNINPDIMRVGGYATSDFAVSSDTTADSKSAPEQAGLQVDSAYVSPLDDLESVDPAIEKALTRDDDLGQLMSQAFSLAPPPMPDVS